MFASYLQVRNWKCEVKSSRIAWDRIQCSRCMKWHVHEYSDGKKNMRYAGDIEYAFDAFLLLPFLWLNIPISISDM